MDSIKGLKPGSILKGNGMTFRIEKVFECDASRYSYIATAKMGFNKNKTTGLFIIYEYFTKSKDNENSGSTTINSNSASKSGKIIDTFQIGDITYEIREFPNDMPLYPDENVCRSNRQADSDDVTQVRDKSNSGNKKKSRWIFPLILTATLFLLIVPIIVIRYECASFIIKKDSHNSEPNDHEDKPSHVTYSLPEMITVEGGSFMMGSNDNPKARPAHLETVEDFKIASTEVTQKLWEDIMEYNPSHFKGPKLPVENVSWNDCQKFIEKLNKATNGNYRLPTEAEWEFAARGGNLSNNYKYSGSDDINEVAWHGGNSNGRTHDVATLAPNELGIYDMTGNVWEWTDDLWSDNYNTERTGYNSNYSSRVYRGGCWFSPSTLYCSLSYRDPWGPDTYGNRLGLRLAQDVSSNISIQDTENEAVED